MPNINDEAQEFYVLEGVTEGAQNDRHLEFLLGRGAVTRSIMDAQNQFLVANGLTVGTQTDRMKQLMATLGYWDGNYSSSLLKFYEGGLPPIP
jgi:hypothetical protein